VFSRFNRDQGTWLALTDAALYPIALDAVRRGDNIRCWSCGCSSGEEAYYLRMIWERRFALHFPEVDFTVIGTDTSAEQIDIARRGVYPLHSVQGVPADWQKDFFHLPADGPAVKSRFGLSAGSYVERQRRKKDNARARAPAARGSPEDNLWHLRETGGIRQAVSFLHQDVAQEMPEGPFDIISSRYAVCLYMEKEQKAEVLSAMVQRLRPGGVLVIGQKDHLPEGFCATEGFSQIVYRAMDEFGPYCSEQLLEDIFRKDAMPSAPTPVLQATHDDRRFKVSTYVEYLKSIGQVPDWIAERERVWIEMRAQNMSDQSRRLLEKACSEGRRTDSEGSLISRMAKDAEDRQERQRTREAQKLIDFEEALHTHQALTKEEASTKVQGFFQRLQQDIGKREVTILENRKVREDSPPPRKKPGRSSKRSSSTPAGGKKRRARSAARTRTVVQTDGEDTMVGQTRGRGRLDLRAVCKQKSSTH